jgi:hypothetical protein
MSCLTMKVGARDDLTVEIECELTNIPLKANFSPKWWKNCIDVMIPKESGVTDLSGL